ncbi:hypothetical protein F7Q92_21455, partial [Ideonella dechloratans]
MLSAFSVEHCPPSWWNTVRHQRGIVSAIAWNTHGAVGGPHLGQDGRLVVGVDLATQGLLAVQQVQRPPHIAECGQ